MKKIPKLTTLLGNGGRNYLRIMKLTTLFCFCSLLPLSASIYSQTTVSLRSERKTVKDVLEQIEQQSKFHFFYNDNFVDLNKVVKIEAKNVNVENLLTKVFEGSSSTYKIVNENLVVIVPREVTQQQQQQRITGTVVDAVTKESLPGVNVVIEGTTTGVVTDLNGKYSIPVSSKDVSLLFSYIGYNAQKISLEGRSSVDVFLEADVKTLDEVIVIGYGTVKKSDLTGSVGVVKANQLDQQTNSNLGSAIQGKIAGVSVEAAGGSPGSGMNLQIRGAGSLNNNNPLILVDDIAVSSMNNINPYDIESMQVLKDASAAAIYGSRAANGVIIITTKSGKKGPIKIDANIDYGVQEVGKRLDLCNTDQWTKIITAATSAGKVKLPDIAANPQVKGNGTDWQDAIFRTAPVMNLSVGATGGSDNINYNLSLGYLKQDGIVKSTGYDRLNLRFKSDLTKGKFKFGESVLLTKETTNDMPGVGGQGGNVIGCAELMIPAFSVYDENAVGGYNGSTGAVLDVFNPVAALNLIKNKDDYYKALVNLYGQYEIVTGLIYKVSTGVTASEHKYSSTSPVYTVAPFSNIKNSMYQQSDLTKYWQLENTLSYNRTFDKHSINAVVGYTSYNITYSQFQASKKGMPDNKWAMDSGTDDPTAGGSSYESSMISYLGRLIYSFDNRYIFTGTFRRDGSSRFSKSNIWGNYPSVSFAWNAANENFMKDLQTPISELKIRTSYGKLGNQEIGDYQFQALITPAISYVQGQTLWVGNIQTNYPAQNLKWESTGTANVGLDLGLWNGKLNFTVDAYQKTTTDLLLQLPIPLSVGATSNPYTNAGKIQNQGIELMLNYNGNVGEFKYSVTGTFSHVKNEVKDLSTGSQELTGGNASHNGSAVTYTKVGSPMYSFFLIKSAGLFRSQAEIDAYAKDGKLIQPNAKPGDLKFVDANNDGKIDGSDRVYCGSPFPKYEYGLRLEGSWRFIDASVYMQGVHGNKIYNGIRTYTESGIYTCNYSTELLNSYTFNPNSDIPRLDMSDPNGNGVDNSDRFLEDGSYLRLKSVQIGFTLPKSLSERYSIDKCRLYLGADNIYTWTNYKGYNADIGNSSITSRGIDFRQYPLCRSYHVGLQLNF